MSLFQKVDFIGHAGQPLDFKIECDDLSDEDIECCAYLLSRRIRPFSHVIGIPRGGRRLSAAIRKYRTNDVRSLLIVDDVYTTGRSFRETTDKLDFSSWYGAVLFARIKTPSYITPLFRMTGEL